MCNNQCMDNLITLIQRLVRHEIQRLTLDGHSRDTAAQMLTARPGGI